MAPAKKIVTKAPPAKAQAAESEESETELDQEPETAVEEKVVREPSDYVKHIQKYKLDNPNVEPKKRQTDAIAAWRKLHPRQEKPPSDFKKYTDERMLDKTLAGKTKAEKKQIISADWRKQRDLNAIDRALAARQAVKTNGAAKKET